MDDWKDDGISQRRLGPQHNEQHRRLDHWTSRIDATYHDTARAGMDRYDEYCRVVPSVGAHHCVLPFARVTCSATSAHGNH